MMRRSIHMVLTAVALAASGSSQQAARTPDFPPDIFDNRSVDEARIAPDRCVVEIDNERLRVLRIKLPAGARVPIHGHRSGVIIALTELNLRLKSPNNAVIEIRLPVGDIR